MDFEVAEVLHEGRLSQVLRGVRRPQNDTVVLKRVPPAALSPSTVARLRYEHRILNQLEAARVPHVVRCLGWVDYAGGPALVLEDLGGRAVGSYSPGKPWDVAEALQIGIHTALALRGLHRAGVIHKDINPSNLVYTRARGALQLIDLGIASELPREVQIADNVRGLEGTLAYIPPEQTGRLARSVDWRADLYALGATLYQLLAGRPPFSIDDTAQLLYAVMAEQPPPLQDWVKVPSEVAQLVHRLLAKDPKDRYQSAHGVLHDLQLCAARLQDAQPQPMTLGTADRSERFALSDKLYGRAEALATLQAAYTDAAQGGCKLTLVRGPSGIGKSALVQELQPAIARDQALFGLGKCDVLHHNVPFHVMRQALSGLMKRLLMEPAAQLEAARRRVQEAVGNVGHGLVSLVVGMEALIGAQRPIPTLAPQENENRLLMLFSAVFAALARRGPLVLFFDDLQWADAGTFKLLTRLALAENHGEKLLLVLAYRDNEVAAGHPLETLLRSLMEQGVQPQVLTLAPLGVDAVTQLISDATATPQATAHALAELVHTKTQGNAFFVRDMLQRLWTHGLLRLDAESGQWTWDAQAIAASAVSAGMADDMLARWQDLKAAAQQALGAAACVGQEFSLQQVCVALQQAPAAGQQALEQAMQEGLLIPLSGDYRYPVGEGLAPELRYRFAHDKVQQAATQHTAETERALWHHRLGNALAEAQAAGTEIDLFSLTEHWNAALANVQAAGQNLQAAEANLHAGQLALQMSAAQPALQCLRIGLGQLPAEAWTQHYELRRDLESSLIEALFMAGNLQEGNVRIDALLTHERTALERAHTLRRRAMMYVWRGVFDASMVDAFAALRLLNFPVVEKVKIYHLAAEFLRLRWSLRGRDIASLGDIPFTQDAQWAETLCVAESLIAAAFGNTPMVMALTCLQTVRGVVQRGLVEESAQTYGYMLPVCTAFGDYAQAHKWRHALRRSMERTPKSPVQAMAGFLQMAYVDHTLLRPALFLEEAERLSQMFMEAGHPVGATWPLMLMRFMTLITSLDTLKTLLARHDGLMRRHAQPEQVHLHDYALAYMAWTEGGDAALKEDVQAVVTEISVHNLVSRTMFWGLLGMARWQDERYDDALGLWRLAFHGQVFDNMDLVLLPVAFFAALSCTHHARKHGLKHVQDGKIFKKSLGRLNALSRGAPDLFGGLAPLMRAEIAALRGGHAQAMALYEEATHKLAGSGWTGLAAAASECAARHAHQVSHYATAAAHLHRALRQYRLLGHRRKVRLLEQAFSTYFDPSWPESDIVAARRFSGDRTSYQATQAHPSHHTTDHTTHQSSDEVDFPSLIAVSKALAQERNVAQVAARILDFTMRNAAANRGVLLLDQKDGKGMVPFADTCKDAWPAPTQLIRLAVHTLEVQLINDVARAAERGVGLRDGRVKAVLVAPLVQQGDCIGVLVLENHVITGAFTQERLALLHLFASQAAVAVESARTRDNLERLVTARTTELKAAHGRILRYERDAAETQMAGGFAHEMRNALASAGYTAQVLFGAMPESLHTRMQDDLDALQRLGSEAPEQLRTELQALYNSMRDCETEREDMGVTVVTSVKRAHSLTEQILRYAEAGTLQPGDDIVRAQDLVGRVLRDLQQGSAHLPADTQVDIPANLVLPMKEEHAYIILRNLLKNAAEALYDSALTQPQRISIHGALTPEGVLLAVEDSAGAIHPEVQQRIFQPFFSTKGAAGTGLGLGLSRKLAQVYGGDLRFSSTPAQGTRFELTLPPVAAPALSRSE